MPRAAGDGKHYHVGVIAVQDPECPSCGHILEGLGTPVGRKDDYISVTSVIGAMLPKDGLVGWAHNIAVEGMLNLAQEKNWNLADPDVTFDKARALLQEFGFTSYAKRDEKAETGSRAHDCLEAYGRAWLFYQADGVTDLEELHQEALGPAWAMRNSMPVEEQGYGYAVLAWLEDWRPQPLIVEEPMYCPCFRHLTRPLGAQGVAGTGDIYWRATKPIAYQRLTPKTKKVSWEVNIAEGAHVLTDLKTSAGFRDSQFIQVVWYGEHMLKVDLQLPVDHNTILRINPDGTYEVKEALASQWSPDIFVSLLNTLSLTKGAS